MRLGVDTNVSAVGAPARPPARPPARTSPLIATPFFGALALRPQITDVAAVLPDIVHEFSLSHTAAGLLTTILVVCMGISALFPSSLFSLIGAHLAVTVALFLIGVAGALRAIATGITVHCVLTMAFGIGAGIAGALFPAIVRYAVADAPALATGTYSIGINGGAGFAAAPAAPLVDATDSWRGTFALFALAGVVSLATWLILSRARPLQQSITAFPFAVLWNRADDLLLAAVVGLQGICFYGLNARLAAAFVERGWTGAEAGWLVAILNFVTLPATLLVALVGDRMSRPIHLVGAAFLLFIAITGVAHMPNDAWVWTVAAGFACGSLFPPCDDAQGRDRGDTARGRGDWWSRARLRLCDLGVGASRRRRLARPRRRLYIGLLAPLSDCCNVGILEPCPSCAYPSRETMI
jgi:CP family cyanate transporter-like MFS transporter